MTPELQLRDIHLPAEPSWWPPAPGWWLLALLLIVAVVVLARAALHGWRKRRRRLALQAEFDRALALVAPAERLAAISQLLRRAARQRDPRAATLTGAAWLEFLDRSCAPEDAIFAHGPGRVLLHGPYRPAPDADAVAALAAPARRCFLILTGAQ